MSDAMRVCVIIVAAGVGSRMGGPINKHLLMLAGQPVLAHTLRAFQRCPAVDEIVLVGGQERLDAYQRLVADYAFSKVRSIVTGGESRQQSSERGLAAAGDADIICIHDGARPLVSQRVIMETIAQAQQHGAAVAAVPAKDTVKVSTDDGFVQQTLDRQRLWQAQTPQAFRGAVARQAHQAASAVFDATDDAVLVEQLGFPVKIVPSDYSNIKITTADDVRLAESLLHDMAQAAEDDA